MERRTLPWIMACGIVALAASPGVALAEGPKPFAVEAGLGAALGLSNNGGTAFQLMQGLAWHPGIGASTPDEGLHVGVEVGEGFGNGFATLSLAGRVGFDVGVDLHSTDLRLVIDPYATVGIGALFPSGTDAQAAFDLGFGGEVKLDIGDTWYVLARPIHIEFYVRDPTTAAYEFLLGGGMRF